MDGFVGIIAVLIATVFTNNIVLSQSLGICPFLGVSKKMDSAVGMGLAVTLVVAVSSTLCFILFEFVLVPLSLEYLQTILFILVIAGLVQLLDILLKKFSPTLYNSLGVYLPLIATNCVILGTANEVVTQGYGLLHSFVYAFGIGLGFLLALVLMAGVRSKNEIALIPKPFQGFPIALITAGLMALAFAGFLGLNFF